MEMAGELGRDGGGLGEFEQDKLSSARLPAESWETDGFGDKTGFVVLEPDATPTSFV